MLALLTAAAITGCPDFVVEAPRERSGVVCTAKDVPAEGVLRVPGRTLSSWDCVGEAKVNETSKGIDISLPANGLAVLGFR